MTPRASALIEAAFNPPIFREMRDAGLHSTSEQERQDWLLARKFSAKGARQCSAVYMRTVIYLVRELMVEACIEPASPVSLPTGEQ